MRRRSSSSASTAETFGAGRFTTGAGAFGFSSFKGKPNRIARSLSFSSSDIVDVTLTGDATEADVGAEVETAAEVGKAVLTGVGFLSSSFLTPFSSVSNLKHKLKSKFKP